MATTDDQRMTLEEFRALPEGPPYYGYEEGELILVALPTPEHQDIVGVLLHVLRQFVRQHQLGRVVMEEEYHATTQGYLRTASVAAGEEFRPQLFPSLGINLIALLGLEPPASPSA